MSDREHHSEQSVKRRLVAILSADAAGYSRLMSEDDVETVRILTTCRKLVGDIVASRNGRVVDAPGDNILVEFSSAVDAVVAATEIQSELKDSNANFTESRRMAFRIGVNLGDIVAEEGRIYGDGVNITARIEALAEAGGICISGKVHAEVYRKLNFDFEDIGEHALKNIPLPVHVYRVRERSPGAMNPAPSSNTTDVPAIAASKSTSTPTTQSKPSVIVLPFANVSGDPEQEFFVDGLTEDILTELSRFHEVLVISRHTSMQYKGQAIDVRQVARDLDVNYVLEGSVRRAGSRIRITAQLIDAAADRHLWAERYDRELKDIFDLQDEMTCTIVSVLPGRMEASARERAARKPTDSMAAYECVITAKLLHHRARREDNLRAQELISRAVELDARYAHAHAWRACILGQAVTSNWSPDPLAALAQIEAELALALTLNENESDVHRVAAALAMMSNDLDKMSYHQERALNLNPNDDLIVVQQGEVLTWLGRGDDAIDCIRKAMRLNPFHPDRFWAHLSRACLVAKRYTEGIEAIQKISARNEEQWALLAACHVGAGNAADAGACLQEVLALAPAFTVSANVQPFLHYKNERDLARHVELLGAAGFAG